MPITTIGRDVDVYPDPGLTIVKFVIVPLDPTVAVILAPDPIVEAILIIGGCRYPPPDPVKITEDIVPDADTATLAADTRRG